MTADCQQMHLILPIVLHMYIWSMCPIPPRVSSVPGTLYTVLIVRLYGVITLLVPLIGAWHSTPSQTILPEYILEQCQIPLPKTGQASFQAVTRPASLFFFFFNFLSVSSRSLGGPLITPGPCSGPTQTHQRLGSACTGRGG